MKISERWLREFVSPAASAEELAERLTLAGIEVAAVHAAIPAFDGVVVGQVLGIEPHPSADKLRVSRVAVGTGAALQIVCGAPNVRVGMYAPVVLAGGHLPDGKVILESQLRGVVSQGMLCSARELGLSEDHSGLLELPPGTVVGRALTEVLGGPDAVLEIEITPNRGDCLSVLGLARELSAIYDLDLRIPKVNPAKVMISEHLPLAVDTPAACPVFAGRVIRGLNTQGTTPLWMSERLRRAGLRSVSLLVDVTQYVMLELGQPMHAYDLAAVQGGLRVRFAQPGESLELLNGTKIALQSDMLVIADDSGAVGLAGIMGGQSTAVRPGTADVFLESACFAPVAIQGRARRLGLTTDAGYRFERGVDPDGQTRALERATQLLQEITAGEPGPIEKVAAETAPLPPLVLRADKLRDLLGVQVPDSEATRVLARLGFVPEKVTGGWRVRPPSWRYDIEIEEDLIEEVGRIYGYDKIPARCPATVPAMLPVPETRVAAGKLRQTLVDRGYCEILSYSFVDGGLQKLLTGASGVLLSNPISDQMTELRTSLWPGLVQAFDFNLNRQQSRIRIFEIGVKFTLHDNEIQEENCIAGLISGPQYPLQWGAASRESDFYDLRGDIEALFAATKRSGGLQAEPAPHPGLHPGQSAKLSLGTVELGWAGELHPTVMRQLGLSQAVFLFELNLAPFLEARLPQLESVPRYPSVHRDLAVVMPEAVPAAQLLSSVRAAAGPRLVDLRIFDIYRGQGIDSGRKSIALGLILQDYSRTLTDTEADEIMSRITGQLRRELGATIRD